MVKICSKCNTEKDVSNFKKIKTQKDGYNGVCNDCKNIPYNKKCVECGNEFSTKYYKVICCSDECKKQHNIKYKKEYSEQNKEEIYRRSRESSFKKRTRHLSNKNCVICKKEFMEKVTNQLTCSAECGNIRLAQKVKEYYISHKNEETIKKDAEYSKKYREENWEYLAKQKKIYSDGHKEEKRLYDKQYREKNKHALEIKQKEYLKTEDGKNARRNSQHRYTARKKGAPVVEKIDYDFIWERDNGKCCLCKKKIDLNIPRNEPMGLQYDHIVPLSKGGEHTNKNLQLSHTVCNQSKNNNISNGVQMHLL